LKRSKAKIIGQKKIARQDLGGLAMARRWMSCTGWDTATVIRKTRFMRPVTLEQTREVARKYLKAEGAVIARVEPP
jgi:hypothetical protein